MGANVGETKVSTSSLWHPPRTGSRSSCSRCFAVEPPRVLRDNRFKTKQHRPERSGFTSGTFLGNTSQPTFALRASPSIIKSRAYYRASARCPTYSPVLVPCRNRLPLSCRLRYDSCRLVPPRWHASFFMTYRELSGVFCDFSVDRSIPSAAHASTTSLSTSSNVLPSD